MMQRFLDDEFCIMPYTYILPKDIKRLRVYLSMKAAVRHVILKPVNFFYFIIFGPSFCSTFWRETYFRPLMWVMVGRGGQGELFSTQNFWLFPAAALKMLIFSATAGNF